MENNEGFIYCKLCLKIPSILHEQIQDEIIFKFLQIFSFAGDWFKRVTWLNMPQYRSDIPQFSNRACCKKYLKHNKHNSLLLALKICSNIFPWTLSVPRNERPVSLDHRPRKTVCFSEQIISKDRYPSIFSRQRGAIVYICYWLFSLKTNLHATIYPSESLL